MRYTRGTGGSYVREKLVVIAGITFNPASPAYDAAQVVELEVAVETFARLHGILSTEIRAD